MSSIKSLFEYQTWPNTFIFCTHSLKGLHDFSLYHVAQFIIADIFCAAADNRQKSNSCPLLSCQVSIVSWIMASISKEAFFGKGILSQPDATVDVLSIFNNPVLSNFCSKCTPIVSYGLLRIFSKHWASHAFIFLHSALKMITDQD